MEIQKKQINNVFLEEELNVCNLLYLRKLLYNFMFDDIITAIPFGIILAFTIGPVFFVLLETSATKGFKSAIIFDLGVIFADIVFIALAFFSTNSILQKIIL